jgi:hypothetical protein
MGKTLSAAEAARLRLAHEVGTINDHIATTAPLPSCITLPKPSHLAMALVGPIIVQPVCAGNGFARLPANLLSPNP